MPPEDFSYSPRGAAQSSQVPISVFADDPATRSELCDDAALAGFHPVDSGPLADVLHDPAFPLHECVLLHGTDVGAVDCAALMELDRRLSDERCNVVASVDPEALDDIYACLSASSPQILVAPSRGERLVALGIVMASRPGNRVRELDEDERIALHRLTEQVAQIAARIDDLAKESRVFRFESPSDEFHGEPERELVRRPRPPLPDPRLVRRIIRQRQLRRKFFDSDLFADPAWDILLDLTAARAEHRRVSVTSLCIASGVPPTTALRWIAQMTEAGLLERFEDEADRRRAFIALSDKAADAMARYFAETGK